MEKLNQKIGSSITDTLTLRYDRTITPNLPKKTWKDFETHNKKLNFEDIEKSICNDIEQKLNNFDGKKICIALSGGVDSTLVLSLIRKINPDIEIDAISFQFSNSENETETASQIANFFNANHHVVFIENYISELPKAISVLQLPFWDLHWYHVVKNAQNISRILFSGDGGDELFGGYTFRYSKFLSLTSETSTPLQKIQTYMQCHERDWVSDQEKLFNKKLNFSWNSLYDTLLPYFNNNLPRLEQVFLADYNGKLLYNFEPVSSRLSNHFNVKVIAPLMNNELLEISPHIPTSEKYDQKSNIGKLLLRKILKQNNADKLISKQKLGFSVNTMNLWKSYGRDTCKKLLSNSNIVNNGLIDNDWIQKYIDKSDLDVRYINKFLGILALEVWYKLFVSNELSSKDTLD